MASQPSKTRALSVSAAVGVALVGAASAGIAAWALQRRRRKSSATGQAVRLRLLYASMTGTSERWARTIAEFVQAAVMEQCAEACFEVTVHDLATFTFDSLLERPAAGVDVVALLLSTHTDGVLPPSCEHFSTLLADHVHDFRVGRAALQHLRYAVIGFGSSVYALAGHFCTAAVRADAGLAALGAKRLAKLVKVTDTRELTPQVDVWQQELMASILELLRSGSTRQAPGVEGHDAAEAAVALPAAGEGVDEDGYNSDDSSTTVGSGDGTANKVASDLEELAEGCAGDNQVKQERREMVTSKHRAQLTKEGYKIIGSHSAVKLCRWTKHQLRGRGGCYKHSFYGITSYQCMEATPSLACANKCVFCWRHHKNPVGTEWKWKMDAPNDIVEEGIELHRRMIRECKGIPGVKKDRFEEAMDVRHCALSLVGEPIMYPRINELLDDLHRRRISTFLVTNAQFPDAIRDLRPITQLYVSVDAGTPETLKAVDRPLFKDFWPRYMDSLKALKNKRQRTVYRLTLVKGQNMSEAGDYAKLVSLGNPDLIEIKSVTFCGESKASSLTIENTPWHDEVKAFCEEMLSKEGLAEHYELACEHQHSCIVLLAQKKYKIDGKWHTWIDYDRFHELVARGEPFGAEDYLAPTPDWALYGSDEAGFDPKETRVYHNRTKKRAQEQKNMYPSDPAEQ
eukprot:TRINITY_DN2186_c0_g1_i2.p1 TRINITY_DN2186_c0_g1~~TRINITY_DN2186_c0_g1_i2.p1  ORF type:complete len:706 (+),score=153.25 TRINITY_DN2186_c0_g1_i2:71-2119(+)